MDSKDLEYSQTYEHQYDNYNYNRGRTAQFSVGETVKVKHCGWPSYFAKVLEVDCSKYNQFLYKLEPLDSRMKPRTIDYWEDYWDRVCPQYTRIFISNREIGPGGIITGGGCDEAHLRPVSKMFQVIYGS